MSKEETVKAKTPFCVGSHARIGFRVFVRAANINGGEGAG